MRDSEVVASIVARDPRGLAEAYDRYAARIFSFCRSQLGEPADAAGAVQDTFVIAASAVSELYDPNRLRPWLYAVARNECHRRLQNGARPATTQDSDGTAVDVYDDARVQPLDLVRAAVIGLSADDQEVIELSLRHQLTGSDLADVLGMPRDYADGLVSRARAHLDTALGALVVARVGRKACPDLESLVAGVDGATSARMRQQVTAHIEGCPVCGRRKRQVLGPVLKLGFAPLGPIPSELRHQVLELATDPAPAAAAERDAICGRAGAFGAYGFPEALAIEAESGPWWRFAPKPLTAIAGAAATAAVAAVAAVAILVVPQKPHQPAARPANLSSPIGPAVAGGQSSPVTSAAAAPGSKAISAAGTRGNVSTVGIQNGGRQFLTAGGALTPAGSLYAVRGTKSTHVAVAAPGHPATHPATHATSPAAGTKKTTAPPSSPAAPPSSTPPSSPAAPPSSAPPSSPAAPPSSTPPSSSPPSTSPTPSDSPSGTEPSIDAAVGSLLSVAAQLAG
ncbi:MAG TPA: sigma-70 family RNA polymerase sigma factor [Streptosporangiaceae bacterium]|jgi:RNA polymerase sigma factor (sigma-70 family)